MKQSTILILATESFEYQSQNPLDLAYLLAQDGHHVVVASPFHPNALAAHNGRGFDLYQLKSPSIHGYAAFFWDALLCAQKLKPDVTIAVNPPASIAADFIKGAGLTSFLHLYLLELILPEEAPRSISPKWVHARAKYADAIWTTSEHRATNMKEAFSTPTRPGVIWNAALHPPKKINPYIQNQLQKKGITATKIIVYAGSLGSINCLEPMIEASRTWKTDAHFVILGFGSKQIRDALEQQSRNTRTVCIEPLSVARTELLEVICAADAGYVAYDHRAPDAIANTVLATPNKLYDCVAAGLPMICSDTPSIQSLVETYSLGQTCDATNAQELENKVDSLFSSMDHHNQMIKQAQPHFQFSAQTQPLRDLIRKQLES